jgi:hypothetical protein
MDQPIAELMVKWFCEGYAKQAAKEEEEEKERKDENRRKV